MLAAPLASAAGGWERCDGTVFADASDPDYRALLAALTGLNETLRQHPREDLISIAGTEAGSQRVGAARARRGARSRSRRPRPAGST